MAKQCRCNCGYRCGGPGKCTLDVLECLQMPAGSGHFEKDCDHDFTGKWIEGKFPEGGSYGSTTCIKCGLSSMAHDARVGP